jgi:hypothetical protein
MRKILILTTALSLSACTADGRVDWGKVGDGVGTGLMVLGAAALIVGTAGLAAGAMYEPAPVYYYVPPAPITCYSNRFGNQVTTNCY